MSHEIDSIHGHPVHKARPNTPDRLIKSFYKKTPMHDCKQLRCSMTAQACRRRRGQAIKAKHLVQVSYAGNQMVGLEYARLALCISCQDYARR